MDSIDPNANVGKKSAFQWMTIISLAALAVTQIGGALKDIGVEFATTEMVEDSVEIKLERLEDLIHAQLDSGVQKLALSMEIGRMRGLDGKDALNYLDSILEFADEKMMDTTWESHYMPWIDNAINEWDELCGNYRITYFNGSKVLMYNACMIGWRICNYSHPPNHDQLDGKWWWYQDLDGNVIILDDVPRKPLT